MKHPVGSARLALVCALVLVAAGCNTPAQPNPSARSRTGHCGGSGRTPGRASHHGHLHHRRADLRRRPVPCDRIPGGDGLDAVAGGPPFWALPHRGHVPLVDLGGPRPSRRRLPVAPGHGPHVLRTDRPLRRHRRPDADGDHDLAVRRVSTGTLGVSAISPVVADTEPLSFTAQCQGAVLADPASSPTTHCGSPFTFHFSASIYTNLPAGTVLRYQWRRSDGALGPEQNLSTGLAAWSIGVSTTWDIGAKEYVGWQTLVLRWHDVSGDHRVETSTPHFSMHCG